MSLLLRVELPDVPGSLGRLASAIGSAGGDIEALEIVEKRHDGTAVDDVLLETPVGVMPDSIVSACNALDGVQVVWISRYAAGSNLFLDLEVVEELTVQPGHRARPARRHAADHLPLRVGGVGRPRRRGAARHRGCPDAIPYVALDQPARLDSVDGEDLLCAAPAHRQGGRGPRPPRRSGVPGVRARPARPPRRPRRLDRRPRLTHTDSSATPSEESRMDPQTNRGRATRVRRPGAVRPTRRRGRRGG